MVLLGSVFLGGKQSLDPIAQHQLGLHAFWGYRTERPANNAGAPDDLALDELPATEIEDLAALEQVPVVHPEA